MTTLNINFFTSLSAISCAVSLASFKLKKTETAGLILFAYLIWSLFGEFFVIGAILYKGIAKYHVPIYYFDRSGPIVEFILCMLFYYYTVEKLREKKRGLFIIALGTIYWVVNLLIFFKTENFNVYFMPFSSFANIVLSTASIYFLQKDADFSALKKSPVFWFTVLLLFYWSTSFFFFIAYDLILKYKFARPFISFFIGRVNDIFFFGLGISYLFYRKKTLT